MFEGKEYIEVECETEVYGPVKSTDHVSVRRKTDWNIFLGFHSPTHIWECCQLTDVDIDPTSSCYETLDHP
jgi:hypothetical protein